MQRTVQIAVAGLALTVAAAGVRRVDELDVVHLQLGLHIVELVLGRQPVHDHPHSHRGEPIGGHLRQPGVRPGHRPGRSLHA